MELLNSLKYNPSDVTEEEKMYSSEIRSRFLKFFENNGHKILESSSVVPQNDPTLLFTNAGMVQFKDIFTGLETRPYKRATTSQKCIRAGGKHNDLDQVGFTARHHTFFEMLGNFSFGDYFKEDAINFAWTFLTRDLGLDKNRLSVTVFHEDEEAAKIWKKVAGDITIIPIATSDNFWSMGDTGPCGPCSEIFFDHGPEIFGGMPGTPDEDGDRYMEIWNIVFMQFEQKAGGERIPLAKKSIDTGMGLERITTAMQGLHDNYECDLFRGLIENIREISHTNHENTFPSYKVIADHIRSVSFLISDGVVPSNEGRGYVLRRILRRAMRHGNLIGIKKPFLFELSKNFISSMKSAYPELEKAEQMVSSTILNEEEKFLDTLDRGLKILQNDTHGLSSGDTLSGDIAFKLYDTYGFPLDLTQDILKSQKISVDVNRFEECLQEQKTRAKWAGSGDKKEEEIWHALKEKLVPTEFKGYETDELESKIIAIVVDGKEVDSIDEKSEGYIVTKATPFYAECGGQCGDCGMITNENATFEVHGTLKFCDTLIAHKGKMTNLSLSVNEKVKLRLGRDNREMTRANHTAVHLLQAALRKILGSHVVQRGSYLNSSRLRFDFSHNAALTSEQLAQVECQVNEWILRHLPVTCDVMKKEDAIAAGAMALFGEKYGAEVRGVKVFDPKNDNSVVSFELCGGTHVSNTSEIGVFKILSECSIGSGIRRIEGITGQNVLDYLNNLERITNSACEKLKCIDQELNSKIDEVLQELKNKNQQLSVSKQKNVLANLKNTTKNDAKIFYAAVDDFRIDEMRSLIDLIRAKNPSGVIILLAKNPGDEKFSVVIGVSDDLKMKYNANNLLKSGVAPFSGKGGGNALLAQGGGSTTSSADEIINRIISNI